jgi:hypothetical protein
MNGLRVVHNIPGRFRLPAPAETEGLTEAVEAKSGVTGCTWSPRTRSLLVRYQPEHISAAEIAASVAQHAGLAAPPDTVEFRDILTTPADQADREQRRKPWRHERQRRRREPVAGRRVTAPGPP